MEGDGFLDEQEEEYQFEVCLGAEMAATSRTICSRWAEAKCAPVVA